MVYITKTVNGVKKKIKVAGFLTGGNPVGSMLTTFKKVNPTNYLYCDGSTFDENQYPALYLYLGTNVLPDYRECVMVGAEKNTTDIFDSTETDPSTGQAGTQNHDVFSQGEFKDDQIQGHHHGVTNSGYFGGLAQLPSWVGYEHNGDQGHLDYNDTSNPHRAGDVDAGYGTPRLGTTTRTKEKAVFVYIKAVDGVDIADEDYFLNTVKNFVEEKNSYSTEETLTGGKWIDGKPIYRRVIQGTSIPSGNIIGSVGNYSDVVSINGVVINNSNNDTIPINYNGQLYCAVKSNGDVSFNVGTITISKFKIVIEYTKTTD